MSDQFPQQPITPQYETPNNRTSSGMALTSMILGICGIATGCFGIGAVLGIIGLILGIIALSRANKNPMQYGGKGYAITGIVTSCVGTFVAFPLVLAMLLPSLGRARELSNRSYCAANLRGIGQSMNIYAADNMDVFPILPSNTATGYTMTSPGSADANAELAINRMYAATPTNGPVLAGPWVLVMRNQTSPKQFICKSDDFASTPAAIPPQISTYPVTFQTNPASATAAPGSLSYSFAYPWTGTPVTVGKWWTALTDSSLPIMSDMAPANGERLNRTTIDAQGGGNSDTAIPAAGNPRSWNSPNHAGDGQNVGFSDVHVEWVRKPTVGQNSDNIWGVGTGSIAVPPAGSVLPISGSTAPFDTVMVPTRTASGALR